MAYRGYFTAEELLTEVNALFPIVAKPPDAQLTLQGDEDLCSRYLREDMRRFVAPKLPPDDVRYLCSELAELSGQGMRWLFPSLLRVLLVHEGRADELSYFVVYDLSGSASRFDSIRLRYGWLDTVQIACLQSLLEYCSEIYGHEVAQAQETLERLRD